MPLPSTLISWCCGSTLAPNLRTVSPSTSTRPSPISSSQCLRLPTPASASTFCSRTPPSTSTSESSPSLISARAVAPPPMRVRPPARVPSSGSGLPVVSRSGREPVMRPARGLVPRSEGEPVPRPARGLLPRSARGLLPRSARGALSRSAGAAAGRPGRRAGRRLAGARLMARILFVIQVVGQVPGELWQFVQAGQTEALEEVARRPEQDRARLVISARFLDEPAQYEGAHHAVTVDAAHRRHPRPADRLAVGDHREGLQRRLGQPDLLPVAHEALNDRSAFLPGVEAPAARDLAQVESALLGGIAGSELAQGGGDVVARPLQHLRDQQVGHWLIGDEHDRFQAGLQARSRDVRLADLRLPRIRLVAGGG